MKRSREQNLPERVRRSRRKHVKRACKYCGCTESRACTVEDPLTGEFTGCSWVSLDPPVCSADACVAKHAKDGAGAVRFPRRD